MSQQPMNLRRAIRIVRRYRLVVSGVVILGFAVGAGYSLAFPAKLSSTALVILTPPKPNIATDTIIATSQPVLSGALPNIGPGTSLEVLGTEVRASSVTPSVLSITAESSKGGQAENIANAVANSYISYIGSSSSPVGPVESRVLIEATSATGSGLTEDLTIYGGIGAAGGLIAGFVLALRIARGDRRLRLRDEIANSIGVPVIAAIPVEVHTDAAGWLTLFDKYRPGPVHAWRLRTILDRLGLTAKSGTNGYGTLSLAILSLSSDRKAFGLGPQLAAFAASLGIPTAFVVTATQEAEATAALRAACATPATRLQDGNLLLAVDTGDGVDSRVARARLVVVVTAVDEESKELPGVARTTVALLGISSGAVTSDQLAQAAAVAADAGSVVAGILVADPDPDDKTTGLVPRPTSPARRSLPTKHAIVREGRIGDRTRPADWSTYASR
jgi:hypothetical protein